MWTATRDRRTGEEEVVAGKVTAVSQRHTLRLGDVAVVHLQPGLHLMRWDTVDLSEAAGPAELDLSQGGTLVVGRGAWRGRTPRVLAAAREARPHLHDPNGQR